MDMYLHDSSAALRIVLRGELAGGYVRELEHVWATAGSILGPRELVVDISGLTNADPGGRELLARMGRSGARVDAEALSRSRSIRGRLRDLIRATNLRHLPGTRRRLVGVADGNTEVRVDAGMH
jgi:hypothetical protein